MRLVGKYVFNSNSAKTSIKYSSSVTTFIIDPRPLLLRYARKQDRRQHTEVLPSINGEKNSSNMALIRRML